MRSLILLSLVLLCVIASADELRLVPTPQRVEMSTGTFAIMRDTPIALGTPSDTEDMFAARQLAAEVKTDLALDLRIGGNGTRPIMIGRIGRDAPFADLASMLPREGDAEGYVLVVTPNGVKAGGKTAAGTFYAVQTLKLLIRANAKEGGIPCCTIIDWPGLKIRGWQDDISRGPIPTLDYLKREVRTMTEYKQNAFTMYTEHVFKLKKHPTIAPPDGITADEVKELVTYAQQYHVQVIGNFQSFGHFANILKVPGYENLGEAGWVISPAKEESYKFLGDVYSEIAPAYESTLFNINCDETGGLGTGASKEMVEKQGLGAVYAGHIDRIADLLKPYGKTPMMWGDIAIAYPDIVPKLPKDLIVLSWGYDPRADFDSAITPFTKLGFRFLVCPGVSCWSEIYPNIAAATVNISNYTRDGARLGAMGMLNTTWDDSGENLFGSNWYPLVWGAECAWKPAIPAKDENANKLRDSRLATFNKAFDGVFYGLAGDAVATAMIDLSALRENTTSGGMRDGNFWADMRSIGNAMDKPDDAVTLSNSGESIAAGLTLIVPKARHNADSIDYAIFAARKAQFAGKRAYAAYELTRPAADPTTRDQTCRLIDALAKDAPKLRGEYVRLWNEENRPWWLDQNTLRYDRLADQIRATADTPILTPSRDPSTNAVGVVITSLTNGDVHYTVDGADPTVDSPLFTGLITMSQTTEVRARLFRDGKPVGDIASETYRILTRAATIDTPLPTYQNYVPTNAFDGDDLTFFWSAREVRANETFTVVLDQPAQLHSITVTTGHPDHPADYVHEGVLEISSDGTTFTKAATFRDGNAQATLDNATVKAIRIRPTVDSNNWLIIREIAIE